MKRSGPLKRKKPMRQRSGRRIVADRELEKARFAVCARANGGCEVRANDDCAGRGNQAHHRLRRTQGGKDTEENLLWTCTPCHGYIHDNPAESYKRGWLLRGAGRTGAP